MSQRPSTCDKGSPWFVGAAVTATPRPGLPAHTDAVRVAQLPDRPVPSLKKDSTLPCEEPVIVQKSESMPQRRLVNWPLVGTIGAMVWVWVVGVIMVGWLASSPTADQANAAPVVAATVVAPTVEMPAPPPTVAVAIKPLDPPAAIVPAKPVDEPVLQPKPEPKPEPVVEKPAAPAKEEIGKYGTAIDFQDDPVEAADKALKNRKILFVLHVSGDFEDPGCT